MGYLEKVLGARMTEGSGRPQKLFLHKSNCSDSRFKFVKCAGDFFFLSIAKIKHRVN